MSYPYFFISKDAIRNDSIFIADEDYMHIIKVLRAKTGDPVWFSDNVDTLYKAKIEKIDDASAKLRIFSSEKIKRRRPEIYLFLCILKKEAMEIAIQKNTEIGVDVIIPVKSSRVVVEITGKKKEGRISRWQHIAYNASKQSKRGFVCRVLDPVIIDSIKPDDYDVFLMPFEGITGTGDSGSLKILPDHFIGSKVKKMEKIAFLIGPEGGFEDNEVIELMKRGACGLNFGKNILRSETASIYMASIIDFLLKISDE